MRTEKTDDIIPPVRKREFRPGERRIESQANLKRMQKDLLDRQMEHTLDSSNPMERQHGFIRSDAGGSQEENATIRRARRIIKNTQPDSLSKAERCRWEAEAKRFENWMSKWMLRRSQMNLRRTDSSEFRAAANFHAENENSQEFARVAERWKNIMNQLYPDSPERANLERIRPT